MNLPILASKVARTLILSLSGAALGFAKPTPLPELPQIVAEPSAATLIAGGTLVFTFLGVRHGSNVQDLPPDASLTIHPEEATDGTISLVGSSAGSLVHYEAPRTPGTYHLRNKDKINLTKTQNVPCFRHGQKRYSDQMESYFTAA